MLGRKTAIGIVLACALLFSALSVANASAAATGYTAFTCKKNESTGTGNFTRAHCKKADAGSGPWYHAGFAEKTSITGTNENTGSETTTTTPTVFKGFLNGIAATVSCATVKASGTLENGKEGEEMFVSGLASITYGSCSVTVPAGKGCVVKGGGWTTKELAFTTKGQGMGLKFSPAVGTTIAEVFIEGCSVTPLNAVWQMSGNYVVPEVEASGTTLTTTHAQMTEAKTFKWSTAFAGIEGAMTLKGPSGAGISMTTPPYTEGPPPAEPRGYTTFTCKNVGAGQGGFSKAHCKKEDASEGGTYGHVAFSGATSITSTNANTAASTTAPASAFLKGTIAGAPVAIGCTTIAGTGTLENGKEGEEMFTSGTGSLTYSECIVSEPAGKGCIVKGGTIKTKELSATTKGQGMNIKFSPKEGTTFAELTIEGCSGGVANGTYPVTGSLVINEIEGLGSTMSTTEGAVTEAGTLLLAGNKAGLETSMTVKGPSGDGLSATTPPYKEVIPQSGFTAFTCKKVESGGRFSKAHCKEEDKVETGGTYKHTGFTGSTSITATNANTAASTTAAAAAFLKGTLGSTKVSVGCNTVSGSGTLSNGVEGTEMFISGTASLTYGGCIVFEPAEKSCVVNGGTIKTKELSATTKGQGMNLKLSPKEGTTFAEITIEGCTGEAVPKGTYSVTGSLTVPEIQPSGTTLSTTEAAVTESGTLLFGGNKAGLETTVTLKGPSGDGLSATTPPYTE